MDLGIGSIGGGALKGVGSGLSSFGHTLWVIGPYVLFLVFVGLVIWLVRWYRSWNCTVIVREQDRNGRVLWTGVDLAKEVKTKEGVFVRLKKFKRTLDVPPSEAKLPKGVNTWTAFLRKNGTDLYWDKTSIKMSDDYKLVLEPIPSTTRLASIVDKRRIINQYYKKGFLDKYGIFIMVFFVMIFAGVLWYFSVQKATEIMNHFNVKDMADIVNSYSVSLDKHSSALEYYARVMDAYMTHNGTVSAAIPGGAIG